MNTDKNAGIHLKICAVLVLTLLCPCMASPAEKDKSTGPVPGPETIVKKIRITGLRYTDPAAVKREILNIEGQPFDPELLDRDRDALEGMGIFASVSIHTVRDEEGVTLDYRFRELPPVIPFISVKVTDQNGWIAGPAVALLSLFGSAIRIEGYARTTVYPELYRAKEYLLYADSRWTGRLPLEYQVWLIMNDSYNPLKEYNEESQIGYVDLFYRVRKKIKVLCSCGFYRVMHDPGADYFTAGDKPEKMFLSSGTSDHVPFAATGLIWDSRDHLTNTHNGLYQELRVSLFGGPLGGPAHYREYLTDTRIFHTIRERNILHLGMLGQFRPGTMGAYDFFHVGGPNSLRTWNPDSSYYGQHELLCTAEYRYEIIRRRYFRILDFDLFIGLQVVAGTDAAVLWGTGQNPEVGSRYAAVYSGIHILFPGFNRLRLEGGINRFDSHDKHFRFGFTAGLWEKTIVQRWRIR